MQLKVNGYHGLRHEDVLLAYKTIKNNTVYVVTKDGVTPICYSIMTGIPIDLIELYKSNNNGKLPYRITEDIISVNYSFWLGGDSHSNITNGLAVEPGEEFRGWKRSKKIRLTTEELESLCSLEYKWMVDPDIQSFIKYHNHKLQDNNYARC